MSWEALKNLFEAVNFGSMSMKEEASSDASSRLSKDGFRFTNQLYEKLSMERGWEASMAANRSDQGMHRMRGIV